jgi:hypothetical protein
VRQSRNALHISLPRNKADPTAAQYQIHWVMTEPINQAESGSAKLTTTSQNVAWTRVR